MPRSWRDILRASQGQAERQPVPEARAGEPGDVLMRGLFAGAASTAGEAVTVLRALELDAVLGCVRVISDSVGALPLRTYMRLQGSGSVREDWSSQTARLLRDEPNEEMTGVDLWSIVAAHLALWGNAFIGKTMVAGSGDVVGLWPIHPDRVQVGRDRGRKVFEVREESGAAVRTFTRGEIIHVRGLSLDGLSGLSTVELARQIVGAGTAMDAYQASFYRNSATPRGTLTTDGKLSDGAAQRLRDQWNALFGGPRNAHRVAVLEHGLTFQPISAQMDDAQFVESQRAVAQKVCRVFRVPPEMVGLDSGNSLTYSTVEGQGIAFERYSVRPWLARIEAALNRDRDLFPGPGRGAFCEFDTQSLLRADLKTRYEAYAMALDPARAWLTPNEVRVWERMQADPSFDHPAASAPVDQVVGSA